MLSIKELLLDENLSTIRNKKTLEILKQSKSEFEDIKPNPDMESSFRFISNTRFVSISNYAKPFEEIRFIIIETKKIKEGLKRDFPMSFIFVFGDSLENRDVYYWNYNEKEMMLEYNFNSQNKSISSVNVLTKYLIKI